MLMQLPREIPRELGLPSNLLELQVRCVYGTRDAGAIWEETYRCVLVNAGFTPRIASPCIFHQKDMDLTCVIHGDDITTLGSDGALDWFESKQSDTFEIKIKGRLGADGIKVRMKFVS